jgi:hypothetical protein
VDVTLLYFEGCPNWEETHARVRQALREAGAPERVTLRRVETDEQAHQLSFRGSPTVLVNGQDPFADPSAPAGMACRVFRTTTGFAASPSAEDLAAALRAAG